MNEWMNTPFHNLTPFYNNKAVQRRRIKKQDPILNIYIKHILQCKIQALVGFTFAEQTI